MELERVLEENERLMKEKDRERQRKIENKEIRRNGKGWGRKIMDKRNIEIITHKDGYK